ncbi:MAG: PilZ domain-containing protein [Bryobacteraceae bacterium]
MLQERTETRLLCAELVDVRWRDKAGRTHKVTAILEDISTSGACVQLETPIPVDTIMRIDHSRGHLEGNVRYCVYREIGYFIGLQFRGGTKWSRGEYRPQHLLDLHNLLARSIRTAARRVHKINVH